MPILLRGCHSHNPMLVQCRLVFVFVLRFLCSSCRFAKQALANRVDGARDLHSSEKTDLQALLRFKSCWNPIWWLVRIQLHFRLALIVLLVVPCLVFRLDTRIRKLRQLLLMQPVHAGLMLQWQVSRKLFSLVVLPIANMDSQRQIRTPEMTLIQR